MRMSRAERIRWFKEALGLEKINAHKGTINCAHCALRFDTYLAEGSTNGEIRPVPKGCAKLYADIEYERQEITRTVTTDERIINRCKIPALNDDSLIVYDITNDEYPILDLTYFDKGTLQKVGIKLFRVKTKEEDLKSRLQSLIRRKKDGTSYGFIWLSYKKNKDAHVINYFVDSQDNNNEVYFIDSQLGQVVDASYFKQFSADVFYLPSAPPEGYAIKQETSEDSLPLSAVTHKEVILKTESAACSPMKTVRDSDFENSVEGEKESSQTSVVSKDTTRIRLLDLGLTQKKVDSIISEWPPTCISSLIKYYSDIEKLNFERKDILKMAKNSSTHLKAVQDNHNELKKLGFNNQQIVRMVSPRGGSNNSAAVVKYKEELKKGGFNIEQIVKMVSFRGGENNLIAVIKYKETLEKLGFNNEHIVKMVSHNAGSKNLDAIMNYKGTLKLNIENIVKKLSRSGGHKILSQLAVEVECNSISESASTGGQHALSKAVRDLNSENSLEGGEISQGSRLLALGLTPKQVDSIISEKWPQTHINSLIKYYAAIARLDFEGEDIIKMAKNSFGHLKAVQDNHNKLKKLGFNNQQIVRMVSPRGGSNNLTAVMKYKEELEKEGLNIEQIVKMVSRRSGHQFLVDSLIGAMPQAAPTIDVECNSIAESAAKVGHDALAKAVRDLNSENSLEEGEVSQGSRLLDLGLTQKQVDSIISEKWPQTHINSLIKYYAVIETLNFEREDIMKMAKNSATHLKAVYHNHNELKKLGFNNQQIVRMVSPRGGSNNLTAVIKYKERLEKEGFNIEQIVKTVSRRSGHKILSQAALTVEVECNSIAESAEKGRHDALVKAVHDLNSENSLEREGGSQRSRLLGLGLTEKQVDSIFSEKWPRTHINSLIQYYAAIARLDFESEDIMKMAKNSATHLIAVHDNHNELNKLGFNNQQIVKMVSPRGGSNNLSAVIKYKEELEKNIGFDNEQIVKVVSYRGGSNNLSAVIKYKKELEKLGFNNEQIVKMVSHDAGSKDLDAIIEHKATIIKPSIKIEKIVKIFSRPRDGLQSFEKYLASCQATQESTRRINLSAEHEKPSLLPEMLSSLLSPAPLITPMFNQHRLENAPENYDSENDFSSKRALLRKG